MTKSAIRDVVDFVLTDWADELDEEQVRRICREVADRLERMSSDVVNDDHGFFENVDAPLTSNE